MNLIEKTKKLNKLLEIIDHIEIKDNNVLIKTNKNIIVQNEGSVVQINSGYHVLLAKEIHLNPEVEFVTDRYIEEFKNINSKMEASKIEASLCP